MREKVSPEFPRRRKYPELSAIALGARARLRLHLAVLLMLLVTSGCTSLRQWWHNGLKVGPNYCPPPAPVSDEWIDAHDPHLSTEPAEVCDWWRVFNDPVLDRLVTMAREQNLSLKIAACRIWEARAMRAVAAGSFWPQSQQMVGTFTRNRFSDNMYPFGSFPFNREYDDWMFGFDAAWELDLWGKIRRAVEAADANLDAQIAGYDDVLVTLQGDVAAAYLQMRTLEERLKYARKNVELQRESLRIAEERFKLGIVSELDVRQAAAQLSTTESMIPKLEEGHRQVQNALYSRSRRPSPHRRPKWWWACPRSCSNAGPISAGPSAWQPPSRHESASPRPSSIRTSPLPARSASRPNSSAICSSGPV